jgi:hypothetical protein
LKSAKFKKYLKIFCVFLSVIWIAGCVFGTVIAEEHGYLYEVFGFYYNFTEDWFSSKLEAEILGLMMIWIPYFFVSISIMSEDILSNK